MVSYNLIQDAALITDIPENSIKKLMRRIAWCMCNDIEEGIKKGENLIHLNLGIGVISIYIEEDTIKYRFTPSNKLENSIKKTINEGENPLILKLEESLVQCLTNPLKKDLT